MTVYKIVAKQSGHYRSNYSPAGWAKRYALHRRTTARKGTGLLVFAKFEDAKQFFLNETNAFALLRCEAGPEVPLPKHRAISRCDVLDVWQGKALRGFSWVSWPEGSSAVEWVVPVEVLRARRGVSR